MTTIGTVRTQWCLTSSSESMHNSYKTYNVMQHVMLFNPPITLDWLETASATSCELEIGEHGCAM
jgi:hypothetical protein